MKKRVAIIRMSSTYGNYVGYDKNLTGDADLNGRK